MENGCGLEPGGGPPTERGPGGSGVGLSGSYIRGGGGGGISGILAATFGLARVGKFQGKLRQAHRTIQNGLQLAADRGEEKLIVLGKLHTMLGSILYEWNELDAATGHLNTSIGIGQEMQDGSVLIGAHGNLSFVKQTRGDPIAASNLMEQALQILEKVNLDEAIATLLEPARARLWLAQGRLEEAVVWAEGSGLSAEDRLEEYHAFISVLIAQGKLDDAISLLDGVQLFAERTGLGGGAPVELLVLQAAVSDAKGEMPQAERILERALAIGEPEGLIRTFEPAAAMLPKILEAHEQGHRAESPGSSLEYLSELVAVFKEIPVHHSSTALERAQQQLREPLTDRELEVLRLIASGMSNRRIAEALIVSVGTIKAHAHNIYGKLDVRSRSQAIARTRDLNLLH